MQVIPKHLLSESLNPCPRLALAAPRALFRDASHLTQQDRKKEKPQTVQAWTNMSRSYRQDLGTRDCWVHYQGYTTTTVRGCLVHCQCYTTMHGLMYRILFLKLSK